MVVINDKHPMLMKNAEVKEEIKDLLHKALDRDEHEIVIKYMEENNYFEDPASTRYHLSCKGGLARHSLIMYRETAKIVDNYRKEIGLVEIQESSVIIACLFHDLCKAGKYKEEIRNIKSEQGYWTQVPYYTVKGETERSDFYGHGSGSVIILLQLGIELNRQEIEAIAHHMGTSGMSGEDLFDRINAYKTNPLSVACHVGDMLATFLVEGVVDNKSVEGLELI